jgi:hypothetical protein
MNRTKTSASRVALACGFVAAMLSFAPHAANANLQRKVSSKRLDEAKKEQVAPKGPLIISISIANQHLTVYDQDVAIAHAPVSTGMAGHATPMGVFSVIQKQRWHESNIYSGAPMPFMQRITWAGVAMHAGVLPGYPASHGCIRMPYEFAVRLYGMTKMGARVFISRNDAKPVEFADPHLFTPKPQLDSQAALPVPASDRVATSDRIASADLQVSSAIARNAVSVIVADASASKRPDDAASTAKADAPAVEPSASDKAASADGSAAAAEPKKTNDPSPAKDAAQSDPNADAPRPAGDAAPSGTIVSQARPAADPTNAEPSNVGPKNVDADTAVKATGGGAASAAPREDNAAKADEPKIDAPVPADVPIPPARPQSATLKPGPVSIFISKKLGKLFVRKAFEAVFDSPVTIANPERSLGTHVFTATGFTEDHTAMHWLLVSMPEAARQEERRADKHREQKAVKAPVEAAPTAAEALARIDIPQDVREHIAELLTPGSSLTISDKDLGPETGASGETDFIVLTR